MCLHASQRGRAECAVGAGKQRESERRWDNTIMTSTGRQSQLCLLCVSAANQNERKLRMSNERAVNCIDNWNGLMRGSGQAGSAGSVGLARHIDVLI